MAKETCPSCGAVYNGRKCRNCLYRPMAARKSTASRPGNESPHPKPRTALRSLLGFVILLILIALLLPILQNWGQGLKATAESNAAGNPLYVTVSMD